MSAPGDRALAGLVARAATLWERVGDPGLAEAGPAIDGRLLAARLKRWHELAAGGDPALLRRRLAWDGLELEQVRRALGAPPARTAAGLPSWAGALRAIIGATGAPDECPDGPWPPVAAACDPRRPLPFEELFLPALRAARGLLHARLGAQGRTAGAGLPGRLSAGAYSALECALLTQLAELCADTLYGIFDRRRTAGHRLLLAQLPAAAPAPARGRYETFLADLGGDGLLAFFRRYPVLGRLAALAVEAWAANSAELIERLEADYDAIHEHLGPGAGTPADDRVAALRLGLSDRHQGGRAVAIVVWESGLRAVYKPKDLGLEAAFAHLLAWCNGHGAPLPLRAPRVLPRDGYGWVEVVERQSCADAAAAARLFQRAGMLLCLLYALGANDAHQENVVARGDELVLIDAETLLQPELYGDAGAARDSVLGIGLLPAWQLGGAGGAAHDLGGLGELGGEQLVGRRRSWRAINSDAMWPEDLPDAPPIGAHEAVLHGRVLTAREYADDLAGGFRAMYAFLLARRDELLGRGSPLAAMAHQRGRFLLRSTASYAATLAASLRPEALRDGVERSLALERLSRDLVRGAGRPEAWPLLAAELRALEGLDIPYLTFDTSGRAVGGAGAPPATGLIKRPAFAAMLARLQRLDEHDAAHQERLIRGALAARGARPHGRGARPGGPADTAPAEPLSAAELVREAQAIAARLRAEAITMGDGGIGWYGPVYHARARRFQLQPIGACLYDGCCGVALFLAALACVTGSDGLRPLALEALRPLRRLLADDDAARELVAAAGVGGGLGLGSALYGLALAARLLRAPELTGGLGRTVALAGPDAAPGRGVLDGGAGAILGLLKLYEATGEPAALAQAQAWGDRLARGQAGDQTLPAGFAEGAAGLGYALLRLARHTGARAHREAGLARLVEAERALAPGDNGGAPGGWCDGAPGVALALLAGRALTSRRPGGAPAAALGALATPGAPLPERDGLCCGTLGQAEILLAAGCLLPAPELRAAARGRAARAVQRARGAGGYALSPGAPGGGLNPGLFQGLAGVGYALLRLAAPERLPPILLWM